MVVSDGEFPLHVQVLTEIAPLLYSYVVPFKKNTIYIVQNKVCFLPPYSDDELCLNVNLEL